MKTKKKKPISIWKKRVRRGKRMAKWLGRAGKAAPAAKKLVPTILKLIKDRK